MDQPLTEPVVTPQPPTMENAPFIDAVGVAIRNGYTAARDTALSLASKANNKANSTATSGKIILDSCREWAQVQPLWVWIAIASYLLISAYFLGYIQPWRREEDATSARPGRIDPTPARVHIDNLGTIPEESSSASSASSTPGMHGSSSVAHASVSRARGSPTSHTSASSDYATPTPHTPVRRTALNRVTAHDDADPASSPLDVSLLQSEAPESYATLRRMGMFDESGTPTRKLLDRSREWSASPSVSFSG